MPISAESVFCDNCGSSDAEIAFKLQDDLYNLPGSFVMNVCQNCGLLYLSPRPTSASMAGYYPVEYANYKAPIESESFPLMRWIRRRKLAKRRQLIERYSNRSSGDLLDVGCATGLFMNEMAQFGWRVQGIEPVQAAADFTRRQYGFQVQTTTLTKASFDESSFDVITFWDVLEHTFSPSRELKKSAELLRPGGLLALTIPNWNSFERKLFRANWQGLDPPRHLFVFPLSVLSSMLNTAGFQVLDELCFMSSYFSFAISVERWLNKKNKMLSKTVSWLLSFPGTRYLFEPWLSSYNRRGQGSVIALFAKRLSD